MTDLRKLQAVIDAAWEGRAQLTPRNLTGELDATVNECIALLDSGKARVAEPQEGRWVVNEWLKKAVLLHFRTHENVVVDAGFTHFYDKVPLKFAGAGDSDLRASGVRVVPTQRFFRSPMKYYPSDNPGKFFIAIPETPKPLDPGHDFHQLMHGNAITVTPMSLQGSDVALATAIDGRLLL